MPLDVKVLQLNMKKAFSAAVELNAAVKKFESYVCLITEPFNNKGYPVSYTHLTLPTIYSV